MEQNLQGSSSQTCPKCGSTGVTLAPIDSGLKLSLSKAGATDIPDAVCPKCIKELKGSASIGLQMAAKDEAKTQYKNELWKSRLTLVKQGRFSMDRKDYASAAIAYEKYLKIICLVTDSTKIDLNPKKFAKTPREITVICSVVWDLMLIYDGIPNFHGKQKECAEILARFLRFSPVYNTMIRKAELEKKRAQNKAAYVHLLKLCGAQSARCFIANSVFQDRQHPSVIALCLFRDTFLRKFAWGRAFVRWYYRNSPAIADFCDQSFILRLLLRPLLQGAAFVVSSTFLLLPRQDS